MSNELVPFPKDKKELIVGSETAWPRGELKCEPNTACYAVKAEFEVVVEASADAVALTDNQVLAALASVKADLRAGLGDDGPVLHSLQKEPLTRLRDMCIQLLERDAVNVDGDDDGLKMAYVEGDNTLKFTLYIPLSHAEMIDESQQYAGVCSEALEDYAFVLKPESDAWKTANAVLSIKKMWCKLSPVTREVRGGRRWNMPVHLRKVTAPEAKSATTPKGMVLAVYEEGALSGFTAGRKVSVLLGKKVVAKDATPAEIQAQYERQPDTGTLEASLQARLTPLYLLPDGPLKRVPLGAVTVEKGGDGDADFTLRVLYVPEATTEIIMAAVASMARKFPGKQILATATLEAEKVKEYEDGHLAVTGFTFYTEDEPDFYDVEAGWQCLAGGEPVVYVRPDAARVRAQQIGLAARRSEKFPSGDRLRVDNLKWETLRKIPGAATLTGRTPRTKAHTDGAAELTKYVVEAAQA